MLACPINSRKDYVIIEYFENIRNFTYPNIQYFFCDNSQDETYHLKLMAEYGFEIDYVSPKHLTASMYMCNSFNKILKKFQESDCTHLLFVECDLLPPPTIIERLLSHNKQVVGVPYFILTGEKSQLWTLDNERSWGNWTNRPRTHREAFLKHNGQLNRVDGNIGFGCTLIKREVLEDYFFMTNVNQKVHTDSVFYRECDDRNIEVWRDESIIVEHRNQNWETVTDN